MSIVDQFKTAYGDDFFDRREVIVRPKHAWHPVCQCGHLDRHHAPAVGGTYPLPEPRTQTVRGEQATTVTVLDGCVGAVKARGAEELVRTVDLEKRVITERMIPTCPCTELRPIAEVDRPNRYFCQRLAADREDPMRHPFPTGVRAFRTHLSRRKAAQTDPDWADAEFERRFTWVDGALRCGMSKCRATDDVLPVFISDRGDTELRCRKHR